MPDRRSVLGQWAVQFGYRHGRPERAVSRQLTQKDVGSAEAEAPEVELRRTSLVVLKIEGAGIVRSRVDRWPEVYWRLPSEIIVRVLAL